MIQLYSIHIPKTGGKFLRTILQEVYGKEKVIYLGPRDSRRLEESPETAIPENVSVVHGQFPFSRLAKIYKNKKAPLITWLRDPVERVISNYFYLCERLKRRPKAHRRQEVPKTLMEYARKPGRQDRMSKFLHGISLSDLFFVGITEHYLEDLKILGRLLNWRDVESVYCSNSKEYPVYGAGVTRQEREEIAELNKKDMELYQEAILLRARRGQVPVQAAV